MKILAFPSSPEDSEPFFNQIKARQIIFSVFLKSADYILILKVWAP